MVYINMWLFHIICTPYAVSGFTQSLSQHSGDTLRNKHLVRDTLRNKHPMRDTLRNKHPMRDTLHNKHLTGDTLHNPQHPGFNPTDPHLPPAAEFGVEFGVIGVDTERAKVVKLRP